MLDFTIPRRGHRYFGDVQVHKEERHWVAAGVIVAIAAAGVTAYAASEQASQQQKQADYNKKVAENQFLYAQEQGKLAAEGEAYRQRRLMSAQHAAYAAAGIDTTEGTPLVTAMESSRLATRDLQLIKYGSDIRASGWAAQAEQQRALSSAYGTQRSTNAGVSLISSGAGIAATYGRPYRYSTNPDAINL